MLRAVLAILTCSFVLVVVSSGESGVERGRDAFQKRCTGCHALDSFKAGPPLRGVYGRRAGSASKFPYSDALKKSNLTWNEEKLDAWLADPDALVPDNDMSFRLDNAAERAAIVSYLKTLGGAQETAR